MMLLRKTIVALLVGTAAVLAGCQAGPARLDTGLRGPVAASAPPGVPASQIDPRQGEALVKARWTLTQVVGHLPEPGFLTAAPAAASQPAATQPSTQPVELDGASLAAQEAYAAGRMALQHDDYTGAIRWLNRALEAAPGRPEILRILGDLYVSVLQNRQRGAVYLEQALRGDPNDVDTLLLLGRNDLELGKWDEAIVILARAVRSPDHPVDPGTLPLVDHLLAGALEREGYDAAAAERYQAYLSDGVLFSRTTRFVRELDLLAQQRGHTWENVGDAYNRLDEPARAAGAYAQSAAYLDDSDSAGLVARLAYTDLRLGRSADACTAVLELVKADPTDAAGATLVRYLVTQGVKPQALAPALQAIYTQSDRPANLATLIADLLPPAQGQQFLWAHLQADPTAGSVFEALLQRRLAQGTSPKVMVQVIRDTVQVIQARPQAARGYLPLLRQAVAKPAELLPAFALLSTKERQLAAARFLHAAVLQWTGKTDDAMAELRALVQAKAPALPPDFIAPRLELAGLLLARGQAQEAQTVMQPLAALSDPRVISLRVRILAQLKHPGQALQLLDEQLTGPNSHDVNLVLLKGALLLQRDGQDGVPAVEQLLWDTLDAQPMAEPLYEALFRLYDEHRTAESDRQRLALLRRALQNIPAARVTRLNLAQEQIRNNAPQEAQRILNLMLAENPNDYAALELMLVALQRDGQGQAAKDLLAKRLAASQVPPTLLLLAQRYYSVIGDNQDLYDVTERLLRLQPASPQRDRQLAALYLQTDRPQQAVQLLMPLMKGPLDKPADYCALLARALLRSDQAGRIDGLFAEAIRRWPADAANLKFEWAMSLDVRGQDQRAKALLEEVLAAHPDHAPAANALGYALATSGQHLNRARELIQRAIKADPNNAAYLDSLGWVYYKLGRFADAAEWLMRARLQPGGDHPVILTHLGDTLWRLGRRPEALRYWRAAQRATTPNMISDDPEVRALVKGLAARIDAITHDRQPPIFSPAPGVAASQPAAIAPAH